MATSSAFFSHQPPFDQLCLVHMVNNLLDGATPLCSKAELDEIAVELAPGTSWWSNPHKSWTGLGNYDANVLMVCLQRRGIACAYHDRRKGASTVLETTSCSSSGGSGGGVKGLILNAATSPNVLRLFGFESRHWTALRLLRSADEDNAADGTRPDSGDWFWFDSRKAAPMRVGAGGDEDSPAGLSAEVVAFLEKHTAAGGEILVATMADQEASSESGGGARDDAPAGGTST